MRRTIFFVFFISFVVSNLFAQNWDINTLHRVNGWDNKFVRNYNKFSQIVGTLLENTTHRHHGR